MRSAGSGIGGLQGYRPDIDGLRAIAVLAVIAFHMGFLPNGYLGVDVFFVISGYLITRLIHTEITGGNFTLMGFYLRRVRRIIPLTLTVSAVALLVGLYGMLPNDLKILAQSVVATNLFSNNILQAITTRNYWDVVNEFKPLMHTWSLGVEEHFYFVYPLLLLGLAAKRGAYLLPGLLLLGITSLSLNWLPVPAFQKFYWMPFRFYELALGGVVAVAQTRPLPLGLLRPVLLTGLVALLAYRSPWLAANLGQPFAVAISAGLMLDGRSPGNIADKLLRNRLTVGIGLISYSLYMWHQPVLAFTRYYFTSTLTPNVLLPVCLLILTLSVLSYFAIEKPFRNRRLVSTRTLLLCITVAYAVVLLPSLYLHFRSGVIRDVPELEITTAAVESDMHSKFNHSAMQYDKPFTESSQVKVLVIGNSFARDWVNVLLSSEHAAQLDISYIEQPFGHAELLTRAGRADRIYYSEAEIDDVARLGLPIHKLTVVGTKNFGVSNGRFYIHGKEGYCEQRTSLQSGTASINDQARKIWSDHYLDLLARLTDTNGMVPVFTPECRFISQDTRHLTRAGAQYFAQLFEAEIRALLPRQAQN